MHLSCHLSAKRTAERQSRGRQFIDLDVVNSPRHRLTERSRFRGVCENLCYICDMDVIPLFLLYIHMLA